MVVSAIVSKNNLLIYAHYYYPDVASTAQLLKDLAEGMSDIFHVTVICVVPSYEGRVEAQYKTLKVYHENINDVRVLRVRVPEFSKADKFSRVKNISSYFFGAIMATFATGSQDFVLSISQPPILGGLLGIWGKWVKRAKFIYNIQDFNPEQIMAVSYNKNKLLLRILMALDKFSCRKSDLVITVGRDLVQTLERRFKGRKVPRHTLINNWTDERKIYPLKAEDEGVLAFRQRYGLDGKFVIMYAGNIGLYYDLENLMKIIQRFGVDTVAADGRHVAFAFVGAGSVLDKLVAYKQVNDMVNVVFIPYQSIDELIYSLNATDVHWCVNAKCIKGVSCPSKFYGILSVGKPVLGVLEKNSEVEMLIREIGCGKCVEPGEYVKIEENIRWFIDNAGSGELSEMGKRGHEYLVHYLTKDISIQKYITAIKGL